MFTVRTANGNLHKTERNQHGNLQNIFVLIALMSALHVSTCYSNGRDAVWSVGEVKDREFIYCNYSFIAIHSTD